jgi:Zn-dependent metalloprotease
MLEALSKSADARIAKAARNTLVASAVLRAQRSILGPMMSAVPFAVGEKRRSVYDAQGTWQLPGALMRTEAGAATADVAVNEAYDGAGATYDFLREMFRRNSLDDAGMRLDSTVHYQEDPSEGYDNAFWNGRQMVYGDGEIFDRFTKSVDVIAHELSHGLTEFTAALKYENQSGALNESMSDCFGIMVKQWVLRQTIDEADWLIGKELFKTFPGALRSLKAPGTAYDHPELGGKDPQPDHMSKFVNLPNTRAGDWGGVHINSGIPNRAFYISCVNLGTKYSWEKAGKIWYLALTSRLNQTSTFVEAKKGTIGAAQELFGAAEADAVRDAWNTVGV